MSSSPDPQRELAAALAAISRVVGELGAADGLGAVPDETMQELLYRPVQLYARKVTGDVALRPFPRRHDLKINDVMLTSTEMLHAMNIELFELSMWQSFTGYFVHPHQRTVEEPETEGASS